MSRIRAVWALLSSTSSMWPSFVDVSYKPKIHCWSTRQPRHTFSRPQDFGWSGPPHMEHQTYSSANLSSIHYTFPTGKNTIVIQLFYQHQWQLIADTLPTASFVAQQKVTDRISLMDSHDLQRIILYEWTECTYILGNGTHIYHVYCCCHSKIPLAL